MNKKINSYTLLSSRSLLFFSIQFIIFSFFFVLGNPDPLMSSVALWPLVAAIGSLLSLLFLLYILKSEGYVYKKLVAFNRKSIKKDIIIYFVLTIVSLPLSFLPNIFFANLLLGSQQASLDLLIQPIPILLLYPLIIMFPLLISLSELPIYFGYLLPKLTEQIGRWKALFLTVFFLSLQHSFLPFLPNLMFFMWRFLMYLPFALFLGIVIKCRRQMLPYLMIGHFLMDLMTIAMYLMFKAYY